MRDTIEPRPRGVATHRWILFLGLLMLVGVALRAGPAAAQVAWSALSLDEALAEAQETGQLVLVDVFSDHCGGCGEQEAQVWSTMDGAVAVQGLIPLKLDSGSAAGQALARRYPVTGLPTVMALDPDGAEIDRIVGYTRKSEFLDQMALLRSGVDPVPELEEQLAANPGDGELTLRVLQKYLDRQRLPEAQVLIERAVVLDPDGKAMLAERALSALARYQDYFLLDPAAADATWRRLAEGYPESSSVGAAIKETFDYAKSNGQLEAWVTWACGLTAKHPEAGRLSYNVAIFASRSQLRGACLAEAARNAKRLGVGPAWMDSIAVVLESK
ncbi:MAG: thioredoxin family protein [Candidatus Eisenbacteria bacterium]|uniref:Thioredoxin family protein n=1 Tax=Eiseniibacteriota bacterium TaxID=2212470 RepID=A0A956LYB3_UNCEI|nr:thioredoxin family protein [Candidatus Eisenbacteria bacterium]